MSENPKPGQWALFTGYGGRLSPDLILVGKVTAKQITGTEPPYTRERRVNRDDLIAAFDERESAERHRQAIHGIRGERDRRIAAAHATADDQFAALATRLETTEAHGE